MCLAVDGAGLGQCKKGVRAGRLHPSNLGAVGP